MFDEFDVTDFPTLKSLRSLPGRPAGFVYVILWIAHEVQVPLYVGQTRRLSERMKDYCKAHFMAVADFRVGEAIRYLRDVKKYRIVLKYKRSDGPTREESTIIRKLHLCGVFPMNDLVGYNYQTAKRAEERRIVRKFCDALVRLSR